MEIKVVTKEEYKTFVIEPFSKFDTPDFIELNKHKVDEVKYFIFENNKKRFGLAVGIKDGVLKSPFSATFSILSEIAKNNKITHYHDSIELLKLWCKKNNIKKIILCTPPVFYNQNHITKFHNSLIANGFRLLDYDVNFQYFLNNFNEDYIKNLSSNSRRNLKLAIKNNLSFEKTNDISSVYSIIKQNREEKGFPLWMSQEDIINTANIIDSDYFLIRNFNSQPIASAYVQHITKDIVNVVYWGNIQETDCLYPMNYLAYKIFEYYSSLKIKKYISIGTSTQDSIPNFGLCNFKESIGCECSPKLNFILEV